MDAMAEAAGGTVPVMTTREMFALKGDPALTKAWAAGSVEERRALLVDNAVKISTAKLDPTVFAGKPVAIDSVEWFASPSAMAGLLARLRGADATTRAVLAVNAGGRSGDREAVWVCRVQGWWRAGGASLELCGAGEGRALVCGDRELAPD
ncbi:hypothetical protein NHF48_010015 [Sphingomonas sp. H160509]|uniref:hypothetical protein n=1 Tax=Sphingomonas sp. H160509 TaxID=2955313 RepID=UPI0021E7CFD8|nr:hypothetical protein [Sphingomonas sp. H160509]MDD1451235.1 hypothetical protein [Sphingomonas sp. H160509]